MEDAVACKVPEIMSQYMASSVAVLLLGMLHLLPCPKLREGVSSAE